MAVNKLLFLLLIGLRNSRKDTEDQDANVACILIFGLLLFSA